MIIKSMPRKEASFGPLINYVSREVSDRKYDIHHNILGREIKDLTNEFENHAKLLKKRKNANMSYHEILSITRAPSGGAGGLSVATQKAALRDITLAYIRARAPENMVFGGLHDDKADNLHYHLVISANPLGLKRRHYLSKKEFRKITTELEDRVLKRYPELDQKVSIKKVAEIKLTKAARAVKARTGKLDKRAAFGSDLRKAFEGISDMDQLRTEMGKRDLQFYTRGKAVGVVHSKTGIKYRLKSLGVMPDYEAMAVRLTTIVRKTGSLAKTLPPQTRKNSKQSNEGKDMDFIFLLNGIGALADVMSITRDVGAEIDAGKSDAQKSEEHKAKNRSAKMKPVQLTPKQQTAANQKATTQTSLKKNVQKKPAQKKTDREIIVAARKAEMEELRKARQRTHSNSKTLKR